MTSVLFKPKGDRPEWRIIYEDLLAHADCNDVITYEQLDDALGRRFRDHRSPIYRARAEMGEMRSRWMEAVPNTGYRVIEAREHIRVAQGHKRKARRQLSIMLRVGEVTDISRLTPDELATYDSQQKVNALLYQVAVHHEMRLVRLETILRQEGRM